MKKRERPRELTEAEMDALTIADVHDPSAWGDLVVVPPSRSPRPEWTRRAKQRSEAARGASGVTTSDGTDTFPSTANDYYVNANSQANGDHELHTGVCTFLPVSTSRTYVGYFSSCQDALRVAREKYERVNGCAFCIPSCHTS